VIERTLFNEEHEMWRESVRRFVEQEIVPFHAQWEHDGIVPRELWLKAGEHGLLCCTVPERYGGPGLDYLFDVVVFEEMWRVGASGPGFLIHTDLVATYILTFGTEEQKCHWLPKMVKGEAIGSLGMTEPHAGSDLKALRTQANRDGDDFIINGQKVFISNGQMCDVIVLATKTDSALGAKGVTLFLIEWTVKYTAERMAFGQSIADFQNTQFVLADLRARATTARVYTDKCIELFMKDKLDPVDAAIAKMVTSELHCETVDKCLQLFGGWGYMWEYPICRAYADARVVKIAGGSIEVMKTIIARDMFKGSLKLKKSSV
jgi:alkylation response protein AidB-like acyl-CoA dehydrogenase